MTRREYILSLLVPILLAQPALAAPGDFDNDCDTDSRDISQFLNCFTGPQIDEGNPPSQACLDVFDFDNDFDIDLANLWKLQNSVTGNLLAQSHDLFDGPLCDQTIQLGDVLEFTASATDPLGGSVSLMAGPIPLPLGATFDTTNGQFKFSPNPTQVGTVAIALSAETPTQTEQRVVMITVDPPLPDTPTGVSGVVLDTNNNPIHGATVSAGGITTATNVLGAFVLNGVADNAVNLIIDGSTANVPGLAFPIVPEQIELALGHVLYSNARNVVTRPIFLPAIDLANADMVQSGQDTMVDSAPGPNQVAMMVAADTAMDPDGMTPFVGLMSITDVPPNQAPIALPDELSPAQLVSIQPGGIQFNPPAPITFPNLDNLPNGEQVDIYSIDPVSGTFEIVGVGTVAGSVIVTTSGGVQTASWHAVLPPAPSPPADGPDLSEVKGTGCASAVGSSASLLDGVLEVDHELVGYRSLDEDRSLRLVYRSDRVNPRPIIPVRPTILQRAAVPNTVSASIRVGGVTMESPVHYNTGGSLSESVDETFRVAVQCNATSVPTGAYNTEIRLTSHYNFTSIGNSTIGKVLVENLTDSSFGSGWSVDGNHQLFLDQDGSALIAEGNGVLRFFKLVGVDDGLIANWPFDDGVNPTSDVANNHDGSLFAATFTSTDIAPVAGNVSALVLNGNGERMVVTVADDFSFQPTEPMSLSIWIKQTQFRSVYHVLGKRIGCTFFNYQMARDNPLFGIDLIGNDLGGDIPIDVWTHIAATFDGSTSRMFLNGIQISTNSTFVFNPTNSAPFILGNSGTCSVGQSFPGIVDELRMYNRPLSPQEVAALAGLDTPINPSFLSPRGDTSTLEKNQDNTFTRTLKNGTRIEFNANGLHTATIDRNGNTTAFAYDGSGRLISITDPMGFVTVFNYTGGLLSSIDHPGARTTTLQHNVAGDLIAITDPDATSVTFQYNNHLLTRRTDTRLFATDYFVTHQPCAMSVSGRVGRWPVFR